MTSFKRLETFYWVAKLASFTAAATKLFSTQSTVSMRIQELEREFGGKLIDRNQRSVVVTERGRELLGYAEKLLSISAEMHERVGSPDTLSGTIRIGVSEVVSLTWLPSLIRRLHAEYPHVRVELEEALTLDLINEFEEGRIDLVLTPKATTRRNVTVLNLGTVKFSWMTGKSLDVPTERVTPAELQKWPVIALSPKSAHHRPIESWFEEGDARIWRMDICKSMNVAASLAATGLGVTLLPVNCFQNYLDRDMLKLINTNPAFPAVEFTAIFPKHSFTSLAQRVAHISQEVSTFEHSWGP